MPMPSSCTAAASVAPGHGQYGVHDIRVVVLRHKARPDARNAVLADEPARDGGTLGRLHGDDAHHAVPCLDVLGHAGDRHVIARRDRAIELPPLVRVRIADTLLFEMEAE